MWAFRPLLDSKQVLTLFLLKGERGLFFFINP